MRSLVVVMSTYNGSQTVIRQLDSIFKQKGVSIICYVRDDGSLDNTVDILKQYANTKHPIIIEEGINVGWERSFLIALKNAPLSDFYAFSDQDDIWFQNKLATGINILNNLDNSIPLMYHCNKISVNKDLRPFSHQVRRTPKPLNHQNAMVQEYAQGCSIIINNKARELITSYLPKKKIAHDFWCGLLCYLFGKVIYDDNRYFYHISYGNNTSGEGHMISCWIGRLKKILWGKEAYFNPCQDLLDGYGDILSEIDKIFSRKILNYKNCLKYKIYLLFSPKFVRDSVLGTISLKLAVLLNRF